MRRHTRAWICCHKLHHISSRDTPAGWYLVFAEGSYPAVRTECSILMILDASCSSAERVAAWHRAPVPFAGRLLSGHLFVRKREPCQPPQFPLAFLAQLFDSYEALCLRSQHTVRLTGGGLLCGTISRGRATVQKPSPTKPSQSRGFWQQVVMRGFLTPSGTNRRPKMGTHLMAVGSASFTSLSSTLSVGLLCSTMDTPVRHCTLVHSAACLSREMNLPVPKPACLKKVLPVHSPSSS